MEVKVIGLVGIVFFYLFITGLGVLLTYRRHWLIRLWGAITSCGKRKQTTESNRHQLTTQNTTNDEDTELENNVEAKKPNSPDIALGGRSLGLLVGSFTLTAGWCGGSFISGTTEEVYRRGLLWTPAPFAYSLSLLVGGLMFSKTMRRNNYVTMLDPFQHRYGYVIGGVFLVPAFIAEVFWSLSLLTSLASILSVVIGLKMGISVGISAVFVVICTMFGGMDLLSNTDLIQLTLIFLSLWACIPIILNNANVASISNNTHLWLNKEPIEPKSIARWMDDVIYLIFGGIPWQTYFQKILSCKSTKVAYKLSFTTSFFCLLMSIPPVLIGAAATTTDWTRFELPKEFSYINLKGINVPMAEYALPQTFVTLLPSAFLFICLGSLAASTVSSTNSSMLSASTMISHNLYKNVIRKNASPKEISIVLRVVIVLTGVFAVGLSFLVSSVYALWYLSSDLVYVILFPRLCSIVYFKFTNSYGGVVGSLMSLTFRMLCGEEALKIPPIINLPPHNADNVSQFPFKTTAMLIGLVLDLSISWLAHYLFVVKKINQKYDFLNMLKSPDFSKSNLIEDSPTDVDKTTNDQ